jgi:tRNA (guanine37-N1)-methyltransferase
MKFDVITIFPEIFSALDYGVIGRAKKNRVIDVRLWDLRKYSNDKHGRIDDRPYGGGPGMVMLFEPLQKAITAAKIADQETAKVIHLTPQGKLLTQKDIQQFADNHISKRLILIASRYEGVDQRVIDQEEDEEWSIGDYVLSGGEIAAMVLIDAITRLLPGVLGADESALDDSFSQGLIEYPHYTRPEIIAGKKVPKVLLSGDHQEIHRWRLKEALGRTWLRRPDLLVKRILTPEENILLKEFIAEQKHLS